MKVLVVGSGGREHALVWKIAQSSLVDKVYCAPGNGGTTAIAESVPIGVEDIESLVSFAKTEGIGLTVVGPEIPLVSGIVDAFEDAGLLIFGPNREAAQLEGSKVFSKIVMSKYGVPTAGFKVFSSSADAKKHLMHLDPPFVIKADGLAAGKGVILAKTTEEAVAAVHQILEDKVFGDAGKQVLIEDFIEGEELSVLALTDGETIVPLASSQDHKRAFDNDEGPNTGGMGAYSPCPLVSHDDLYAIVDVAVKPVIDGLREEGVVYKGLIYAGLMISKQGPMVLEYNVRFGDPETQAVLPRLKNDIVPLFLEIAKGKLETTELRWDHRSCIDIVIAAGGYPGDYEKGKIINGLDDAASDSDVVVFHAGTKMSDDGECVTSGGRVLGVSALGDTIKAAREKGYAAVKKISFDGAFYRSDIGTKALQHNA